MVNRRRSSSGDYAILAGAVGIVALISAYEYEANIATATQTCTLSDKPGDRIYTSDSSKYIIFTKDCGEFENTDATLKLKWNSSAVQNTAYNNAGKQVEITYTGWRNWFTSSYPNVITLTPKGPGG